MARAYAEIAFTPAVRALQAQYGSNRAYERLLADDATGGAEIGEAEAAFIAERDGVYQATVSETGWPYVQFRGGPKGFMRVLDGTTLGYADFRGNRQYLSVGNLTTDDRVALIFMDYPNRRRLKLWGRARLVSADEDPELVTRLHVEGYKAKPERAVLIDVAAVDWNCPQHIPQRFTIEELRQHLAPLEAELARLREENAELRAFLGSGD